MKRREWIASFTVLALIAGAAVFLATHRNRQHLGKPGVRVAARTMYGFDETARTNAPFVVGTNSIPLPERILDYNSQAEMIGRLTVNTLPKDTTFGRRVYFRTNESPLVCQVVLMGSDRTSIHKPQFCLKGMGLNITASEAVNIPVERPHRYDLPVMRLNVRGNGRDQNGNPQTVGGVFVYWFVTDGELTSSHWNRNWWIARDMLLGGVLQRWAYVICYTPCRVGEEDATFEKLKRFIGAAVPEFQVTAGPPVDSARAAAK